MSAYLLTWNPANWVWDDLHETIAVVQSGNAVEFVWSSGNTKSIPVGSRVYLLRQGAEPRGIMASGWTTGDVEENPHWDAMRADRGDLANFVPFVFDVLLDPASDLLLDPRDFPPALASAAHWSPFASGTSIRSDVADQVEALWTDHTAGAPSLGTSDVELGAVEGELRYRMVKHRSRERSLRDAKIAAAMDTGRLACEVPGCGFDFEARYGALGRGYAQVHHLQPLASLDAPRRTALDDLAIVCANCHAMVHRGGESRPLDSLIEQSPFT